MKNKKTKQNQNTKNKNNISNSLSTKQDKTRYFFYFDHGFMNCLSI